jgi:hypothetical protein
MPLELFQMNAYGDIWQAPDLFEQDPETSDDSDPEQATMTEGTR